MEKAYYIKFIKLELVDISENKLKLHGDCVACHLIFKLKEKLEGSDKEAADLLSEILTNDPKLNADFIEIVEQIHMHDRNLGSNFLKKDRVSKDHYLEAYFSNVLDELSSDMITASPHLLLRKLLLSYLGLYLAQTIGVDYHAATEELYYLLRKDDRKNSKISQLIAKFESRIKTFSNPKE